MIDTSVDSIALNVHSVGSGRWDECHELNFVARSYLCRTPWRVNERFLYCRLRVSGKTENHSLRIGTFECISIDAESFNALNRG